MQSLDSTKKFINIYSLKSSNMAYDISLNGRRLYSKSRQPHLHDSGIVTEHAPDKVSFYIPVAEDITPYAAAVAQSGGPLNEAVLEKLIERDWIEADGSWKRPLEMRLTMREADSGYELQIDVVDKSARTGPLPEGHTGTLELLRRRGVEERIN